MSAEDRRRADLVRQVVSVRLGVPAEAITDARRLAPPALRARRVALYLAYVSLNWQMERVGHAFGVNRQTAARACRRIEDARDEANVNALLEQMEDAIRAVCDAAPASGLPEVA
ncbi:MAG: chromosomal replication initiator DnaA [Alphaproteobacteria bacterium]|nr:chromosomal replication initiator DnaA [Alphaproteobacteria bacterium]